MEHEADILLYKAAKKTFDDLRLKKLPTIKSLQAEYTQLIAQKRKYRAEYKSCRQEMRNLLTAKANVEQLLKMEIDAASIKNISHDKGR